MCTLGVWTGIGKDIYLVEVGGLGVWCLGRASVYTTQSRITLGAQRKHASTLQMRLCYNVSKPRGNLYPVPSVDFCFIELEFNSWLWRSRWRF